MAVVPLLAQYCTCILLLSTYMPQLLHSHVCCAQWKMHSAQAIKHVVCGTAAGSSFPRASRWHKQVTGGWRWRASYNHHQHMHNGMHAEMHFICICMYKVYYNVYNTIHGFRRSICPCVVLFMCVHVPCRHLTHSRITFSSFVSCIPCAGAHTRHCILRKRHCRLAHGIRSEHLYAIAHVNKLFDRFKCSSSENIHGWMVETWPAICVV